MDIVFIREFRCEAWIGVYDWEQQRPQTLEFDIELGVPEGDAGKSDKIKDTIDYGKVVERVEQELKSAKFRLLEALSEHLAHIIIHELKAPWVRISVAKLNHMRNVKRLGVRIVRTAPGVSADALRGVL